MSKAMQLVGSKISLISKSEIRYEGILFTINPTESTLALAKVRMFGTENRPTDTPVAPQDEVFEFIIFRGQDIKDIRLCEAPVPAPAPSGLPYDPAIVQHSASSLPSMGGFQQPNPLSSSMMRPAYGPLGIPGMYPNLVGAEGSAAPGGPLGQMGAFGLGSGLGLGALGLSGPAAVAAASELPLSPREIPPHPDQGSETSGPAEQDLLGGVRSTSSTPVGQSSAPIGSGARKSPPADHGGQFNREERRASSRNSIGASQGLRDESISSQKGQGDGQNFQRGGIAAGRGASSGRRGRSRGRPGPQNYNRYQPNVNQRPRDPLKFDGDYDFESANIKFEELKNKMGKMKIGNDTVLVLNGPISLDDAKEKEPEQSEAAHTADEVNIEPPPAEEVKQSEEQTKHCYDKKKSFFDSISCEAVERSKGNLPRTDWRQERKLNAETFGLGFNRRGGYNRGGGGGYRPRGNQYRSNMNQGEGSGYQRGGMNRGGYRGGRGSRGGGAQGDGMGSQRGGYAPRRRDWGQQQQPQQDNRA